MAIKTKRDLIAAFSANPTSKLLWNLTSSGKNGIYTLDGETVSTRAAESVILFGCLVEIKRAASWNRRVWWFAGIDSPLQNS